MNSINLDAIIHPKKGKKSPQLGPVAVMVATEPDLWLLCALFNLKEISFQKVFISRLYLEKKIIPNISIIGPLVGAPYAVMLLENLIAWGARKIFFLGWCGAVSEEVKIGEIVLPTSAIIDEGTSAHYGAMDNRLSRASSSMVSMIRRTLEENQINFHAGAVWSTDALYRETRHQVETHQQNGILAVEMEISALYTVARFRRVDLRGILVVSDELSSLKWRPGFKQGRFVQGRQSACKVVKELCQA